MFDKLSLLMVEKVFAIDPSGPGGAANTATSRGSNGFFNLFKLDTRNTSGVADAKTSLSNVIGFAMNWFLAIAALIAFIYLVLSGIKYITAGGDAAKATEARTGIINAIIGIVVIVLAWTIIRFAVGLGNDLSPEIGR